MTPAEIKAALVLKDIKLTDIADATGTSLPEVSRCINGEGLYMKIREEIARLLDKKVSRVFSKNIYAQPKRRQEAA